MTLGEHIAALRNAKNLSQGDLAEKLDVSRQSVSKWETNGSVPELDKLVKLTEVFGISLDELVKGERPPAPQPVSKKERGSVQKLVGVILLCFGLLATLILLFLGGGLFSMFFTSPFLICGTLCLTVKKHLGLFCAWAVYACVDVYLRFATGITWSVILHTFRWTWEMNYARLAIGWFQFAGLLLLAVCTLRAFRRATVPLDRKHLTIFGCGWLLLLALDLGWRGTVKAVFAAMESNAISTQTMGVILHLGGGVKQYLSLALLLALLVWTLAFYRQRRKKP